MSEELSLIFMVFCGQGQMLLQYIHFVNRCINGCMCPSFHRTVNWLSVPAATLFPQGPKSPPTSPTKPSGGLVPGLRLVVLSYPQFAQFVGFLPLNLSRLHTSVLPAAAKVHGCAMWAAGTTRAVWQRSRLAPTYQNPQPEKCAQQWLADSGKCWNGQW